MIRRFLGIVVLAAMVTLPAAAYARGVPGGEAVRIGAVPPEEGVTY